MAAAEHPFLAGLRPTLHIAHRGGAALYPENTLLAFSRAAELHRTQMLELDVHLTRDGELVVSHDSSVDRCTEGTGNISELTAAELAQLDAGHAFTPDGGRSFPFRGQGLRIPAFRDVLRAFPHLRLNVDCKADVPGIVEALARVVREENAAARVCCGSESDGLGRRLVAALPEACHFYPAEALTALVMAAKMGESLPEEPQFRVLDMPLYFQGMRLIDVPFLERMRAAGKWVNVWTVDDADEMRALVGEGVGGIMTDRPDVLRAVLDGAAAANRPSRQP